MNVVCVCYGKCRFGVDGVEGVLLSRGCVVACSGWVGGGWSLVSAVCECFEEEAAAGSEGGEGGVSVQETEESWSWWQ